MTKNIITAGVATVLLFAGQVAAQTYYPTYQQSSATCVNVARDLFVGSRGADVSSVQTFLVAQNYPGSGSWMVTGYFGEATKAAVRNFQSSRGISMTGVVDAATRAALANCSGQYGYPYQSYDPYSYFTQPFPNTYYSPTPYHGVQLPDPSPTTATPGSQVTVYGNGFDTYNNTVYVGSYSLANVTSYNGTSLSFTVPAYVSGVVQVSVTNMRGTSNALSLTVTQQYPYPCTGYGYGYGQYCPPPVGGISISSLSPMQGAIGSTVTVYGYGFSRTGNSVRFGNGIITNVSSSFDGTSVNFTIPTQLTGYGSQPITLGTYQVSVMNAQGQTSNTLPFTVTSLGSYGAPNISSVSGPNTLVAGNTGTWTVIVSAPTNTYTTLSVRWGDENLYSYALSAPQSQYISGTQTFSFTHSYREQGTYTITFTATGQSGQQNTATATVTVTPGGGIGIVSLASVSPSSGRVGTGVILYGTGFTAYDNTIYFGIGGMRNLQSFNNGTMIYYTIPSYVSPCDLVSPSNTCLATAYTQPIAPGTYQIRVSNANGSSQYLNFTVTQ